MANPCIASPSFQSAWMVFSAPEITTVSNPKRNPASAETSDQRKMRLFMDRRSMERTIGETRQKTPCRNEGGRRQESVDFSSGVGVRKSFFQNLYFLQNIL